ncbi:MAG: GNAT family N-acetyltransferase [Cellvibrionales bacterium]|nr:GNAT family N-acetyltransferase [Cellvibrionales bacterium]
MDFISGFSDAIKPETKQALFEYRYKVFIERLGWDMATQNGIEIDQFDHDGTFHIIANSPEGEVVGCARLLPTTKPYLLEDVFPELLNGQPAPKSDDVWELSRFTTVNLNTQQKTQGAMQAQLPHETLQNLLYKAMACAKENGAKMIISVSPLGIERLLRNLGVPSKRMGPPLLIDGHKLIACLIAIPENLTL